MTFFTFGFTLSCFKITSFIIDNAVFHFITQQDSQEYQTKLAKLEDVRLHLLDHYRPRFENRYNLLRPTSRASLTVASEADQLTWRKLTTPPRE
jgi:hypothetical protein